MDDAGVRVCRAVGLGPLELVIILLVVLVPILLLIALVWIVRRARSRPCPRCGSRVKKGEMICKQCAFDFSTIGAPSASPLLS